MARRKSCRIKSSKDLRSQQKLALHNFPFRFIFCRFNPQFASIPFYLGKYCRQALCEVIFHLYQMKRNFPSCFRAFSSAFMVQREFCSFSYSLLQSDWNVDTRQLWTAIKCLVLAVCLRSWEELKTKWNQEWIESRYKWESAWKRARTTVKNKK